MLTAKESRLNVRIPRELEDRRPIRKVPKTESGREPYAKFVIKLKNCPPATIKSCFPEDEVLKHYESVISGNKCNFIQQLFESANSLQENIQMVFPKFRGANEVVISPHFKKTEKRLAAGSDSKPKRRSFSCRRKKSLEESDSSKVDKITLLQDEISCLRNEIAEMKNKPFQDNSLQDVNQKVETLMRIVLDMKSSQDSTAQSFMDQMKLNIPPPPPPRSSNISTMKPEVLQSMKSNVSMEKSRDQSLQNTITSSPQRLKEKSSNIFKNIAKRSVKTSKDSSEVQDSSSNKASMVRLQSGRDSNLPTTNYAQFYQEISSSDVRCEGSHVSNEANPCNSIVPASDILKQIRDISLERDLSDVFLSILSYNSTSDFRVNVNEKSTGKMLGFFMVDEDTFQKSYKDGVFDKFLTLFILTPGQSNRKNMILNTFLLAK